MRRNPIPFLLALALSALAGLRWSPEWDRVAYDSASRWALGRAARAPEDVVLIGIDEASVAATPEPLGLWHRSYGRLLEGLARTGPRAIVLDVVPPTRSFDGVVPGLDEAFVDGLVVARQTCPTVMGLGLDQQGRVDPVHRPLLNVLGLDGLGLIAVPLDPDGVPRRVVRGLSTGEGSLPTLATRALEAMDRPAREGLLDFGAGGHLTYIPFHKALAACDQDDAAFAARMRGKVVVVGSVLPYGDRPRSTVPLAAWESRQATQPGVLTHVQALRNGLGRGPLRPLPFPAVLAVSALALLVGGGLAGIPWRRALPALGGGLGLLLIATLLLYRKGHWFAPSLPATSLLLGWALPRAWMASAHLRERLRLRRVFGGFVSPGVLSGILKGDVDPGLEGTRVRVAILFMDLRGFTAFSEARDPRQVIGVLNRIYARMVPLIHAEGGSVDKFMGDGLMAHFGHPVALDRPGAAALRAAQAMHGALQELNAEFHQETLPPFRFGFGIHVGEVVMGWIGSRDRYEPTATGDTVNLASRLESLTKKAGRTILLSDAAKADLDPGEALEDLGFQAIPGRSEVRVWAAL